MVHGSQWCSYADVSCEKDLLERWVNNASVSEIAQIQ